MYLKMGEFYGMSVRPLENCLKKHMSVVPAVPFLRIYSLDKYSMNKRADEPDYLSQHCL